VLKHRDSQMSMKEPPKTTRSRESRKAKSKFDFIVETEKVMKKQEHGH
jgi:hypothetical protein